MLRYPAELIKARLIRRINRFVAEVNFNNENLNVYVPNTGRLSELALPGTEVLLSPINAKYKFKILYIINRSFPVMIDSTYSNRLFKNLLKEKKVPGYENCLSFKSEPVYGNHRFDFLLRMESDDLFIELKSCTLFHNKTGAFPDAVSSRAAEHVKALAESGKGKLIFLVLKNDIEQFLPNYHTDFLFYETLKFYKNSIDIQAFTVRYDDNLRIQLLKEIPVIIPEVKLRGIYLLILFNPSDSVNSSGDVFKSGFYIYCGEAGSNIFRIIDSVKKKNGIKKILPDDQFSEMKIVSNHPIIDTGITINEIQTKLFDHRDSEVITDRGNHTDKKLIYYKTNPAEQAWFWDLILELRFGMYK